MLFFQCHGISNDFELILPKTAALREKDKLKTVDEDLSACESSSPISDVNSEKTVNFQDKTLEEDLSNFDHLCST